jgi:hydrogenase maturation protein HypF
MPHPVLALGAWLKNSACLLDAAGAAHWSPLHGDLGTPEACAALEASAEALLRRAGPGLAALAHDLHPDFHSTRLAQELAARLGLPAVGVQHHHAHLAVVLAEHGLSGAAPVVGWALDGFGLGSDGGAWGGELLVLRGAGLQRLAHLQPLALPGGDAAAREPWRMAAAALHAMGRGDEIVPRFAAVVGAGAARGVAQLLQRGLRCPATSSAGRWFDAAAAALGLCLKQTDEAQAAIALERAAADWLAGPGARSVEVLSEGDAATTTSGLDLRPLLARLFALGERGAVGEGAALFHATLADALAGAAIAACTSQRADTVALGGGCCFNRLLVERLTVRLQRAGLRVLRPQRVSCGDAGLALGQAWVARQGLIAPAGRAGHPLEIASCV